MKPKMVGADTFLEAKYAAKDQEKKDYFREWNTADFVGKCEILYSTSVLGVWK